MNIIDQIIELKKMYNLLEDDFNLEKAYKWYAYCLDNDLIELDMDGDKLTGFLVHVGVKDVPTSLKDIALDYEHIKDGKKILVSEVVVYKDNIRKLTRSAINKHLDADIYVWHSKKHDRFVYHNNKRREYALSV